MILDKINKAGDIKHIPKSQYDELAGEIRSFLIEKTSKAGGHLASNLGVVELTMALHLVFNPPRDKIIWDVGHQSYTHKILTGRKDNFDTLRSFGGMSGFPKRKESACDCFDTGHSSTSISAGLGMATARDLRGANYSVISVIGDGSLTGGMAYEALNNASNLKTNFIIVLNDNTMSISPNVGGISTFLSNLRTSDKYTELKQSVTAGIKEIPGLGKGLYNTISGTKKSIKQAFVKGGMLFEDMDITYLGPFDGHDVEQLIRAFKSARRVQGPVIVHVITKKGKGYKPAYENPSKFHGVDPFDIETGKSIKKYKGITYSSVFEQTMVKLGSKHQNLVAITAAMMEGTGLSSFAHAFPDRFFDVGIAEQHAVTFAAGLASQGYHPVVAVYSSFLQRSFDQILHDVCIQDLPVIFAVDRAGIVGADGETHQGIFDLSYLNAIPNMTVLAPGSDEEFKKCLEFAAEFKHPIAIRYPRGSAYHAQGDVSPIKPHKAEVIKEESRVALLALGSMVETSLEVHDKLASMDTQSSVINMRFEKPFDTDVINRMAKNHEVLVTLEENISSGGFGERISTYVMDNNINTRVLRICLPDGYIEHGDVPSLKKLTGIDADSITDKITEFLAYEEQT
ncbi:MAG: 1-deoxy-D-xylulose-5-phosphate synthase [Lachnospiraceae bacterium]|nr:1-deoxy-D-xylulose-5-phosphate synthase [Lachnospiraceae bacterium]